MESKPTKLYGLDHLRALAIVLVFLFHYGRLFPHPEWVNTISKFGWTGVDLFFVLSGYLIASQLFLKIATANKFSLKEFFIKRFFRIIPAYLLVVAIYFLFPFVREREALAPLWKYLTFTQNIFLDVRTRGTFSHCWSLCIEEQFYFFLPLILTALIYFKAFSKGYLILIILFLSGFVFRFYSYQHFIEPIKNSDEAWGVLWSKYIYYPTYCRLDGLLVGVGIAALFQFKQNLKNKISKHGNLLLLLSIFIFTAANFLCDDMQSFHASVFGFPLVSVGYGVMVVGAISPTSFLYKWNSKTTTFIATLSYSIYLVHKIVIHVTQQQFSNFGFEKESNWVFLFCFAATVIAAFAMNKIIEKPFQKIKNKILKNNI